MSSELRDSAVAWLGSVPTAWEIVPARALFGERKGRSAVSDVHLTPSQKYGVLPQEEYMKITGNKVVLNLTGADNMRHVEAGDYVSHLRSFQGGLEYAGIPGKVSAAYTVLKPKVTLDSRFFRYLFKSDLYVQALQTTTDQLRDGQSIRYPQFSQISLPQPPLEEQRAIADYLDRETAQIDAFIAKNENLSSSSPSAAPRTSMPCCRRQEKSERKSSSVGCLRSTTVIVAPRTRRGMSLSATVFRSSTPDIS